MRTQWFSFAGLALALLSCDAAKNFIDPSGKAYGTPPDTSQKSAPPPAETRKSAETNNPPPPAAAPAPLPEVLPPPPPAPAPAPRKSYPALDNGLALKLAANMLLSVPEGWIEFHHGRAVDHGRNLTLWDSSERPWGVSLTDLDQDGDDDALFLVRSLRRTDTTWILAVTVRREGKLQCIQSIRLPVTGVPTLESTQGGVLVMTESGTPILYGWVGGELRGN